MENLQNGELLLGEGEEREKIWNLIYRKEVC